MSGIYIQNVSLPVDGDFELWIAVRKDGSFTYNVRGGWQDGKQKAVPVPNHGRLVDADVQDAQIEALIERHLHGYTKSTWDFVCELRDILKRNRTIIPADET